MSDSWSSTTDAETDLQSHYDQFVHLHDQVLESAEWLDKNDFSASFASDLAVELKEVARSLTGYDIGLLFANDLSAASQMVASRPDYRSVNVLRYCLSQLGVYLAEVAKSQSDKPSCLLVPFSELASLNRMPLLCEGLLTVPDIFRVDADQLLVDTDRHDTAAHDYLGFSQTLLGVYRGDSREQKLQQLSASFESIANTLDDSKAHAFWMACSAFVSTVDTPPGELSPAVFKIFKDIESVLIYTLGENTAPVLGMQQNVDRLLCSLLCYIYDNGSKPVSEIEDQFRFSSFYQELDLLHQETPSPMSPWLETSITVMAERLEHCAALFTEQVLRSDQSSEDTVTEIQLLKRLFTLVGVQGARMNLEEVGVYLCQPVTEESLQASSVSVQLVQQQLLYQFVFLNGDEGSGQSHSTEEHNTSKSSALSSNIYDSFTDVDQPPVDQNFAARCNGCIDVIQQSLDTALGSSGNLIPDSSVVDALTSLIDIVSVEGIEELINLLTPLSQLLTKAENSTLNQAETLLVQEAIIAATLGIDSLVGDKPMPELITDVTNRVEQVLETASNRLHTDLARNSSLDHFIDEAAELLPRLFELFQRLRVAPVGTSRLYADINRLLHAFKCSADEAGELGSATLVHYLESALVDVSVANARVSKEFIDLAIEAVDSLDEDTERLRNREPAIDRADLVDRLRLAGASEQPRPGSDSSAPLYRSTGRVEPDTTAAAPSPRDSSNTVSTVRVDQSIGVEGEVNWSARMQHVEACCSAIAHSHDQLLELQTRLEETLSIGAGSKSLDAENREVQLQALSRQLAQVTTTQSAAIKKLDRGITTASTLEAAGLANVLVNSVEQSASGDDIRVQFVFEAADVRLHKSMFDVLSQSLTALLHSIVTHTIPSTLGATTSSADATEAVTVSVAFQQTASAIVVDIADNGAGVTVHGAERRSDNPWRQVTRPDTNEIPDAQTSGLPKARSRLDNQPIDLDGLIEVASQYGGTVAIRSDESGASYRLCLPVPARVREVMVVKVRDRLLAIPAPVVVSVDLADSGVSQSLAQLIGIDKPSAFENPDSPNTESHCITCRTVFGVQKYLVDNVIGQQTIEVNDADRLLPDLPGYTGVAITESGLALVMDIDRWVDQPSLPGP